jgi:RNA polymerase sigma factor (sigma-70 family)
LAQTPESFTKLLQRARAEGDDGIAAAELMPIVYEELRALAERQLGAERRGGHTLQPTALVHEVWLRMADDRIARVEDRAHFRSLCARVMRRLLVEHARRKNADKRGGSHGRVTIAGGREDGADDGDGSAALGVDPADARAERSLDVVALDEALERLAALDARKARVVDLRWFGGLGNAEVAEVLGVGLRTVEADWAFARAWLRGELGADGV